MNVIFVIENPTSNVPLCRIWFLLRTTVSSLSLIAAIALQVTVANAATPGFLPGDAFFACSLGERHLSSSFKDGNIAEFTYRPPFNCAALGGHVGFWNIQIKEVSPHVASEIRDLYLYLRTRGGYRKQEEIRHSSDGSPTKIELNPFTMFVVNRSFSIDKFRVGIKYNEDWSKTVIGGFNDAPLPAMYCSFVTGDAAVIEDWRNSTNVKPLNAKLPEDIEWNIVGKRIQTPVVVHFSEVKFIIVPHGELDSCFLQKVDASLFTVSSDGVKKISWVRKNGDKNTVEEDLILRSDD